MPIPDFQSVMLPLLRFMKDKKEHSIPEIVSYLGKEFKLTPQELEELLPSGKQTIFYNRVTWARIYIAKAGLLSQIRRSYHQITDQGIKVLANNPAKINLEFLKQFPEFLEFRERKQKTITPYITEEQISENHTPEEILEDAYQEIREDLIQEILDTVKTCPASFFERLVVELLVKIGYGGSRKEASRAVGKSGDGGIDGIIDEDRLGLDAIYIQAKRWEGNVGRPEIQKFVGALMGKKAKKGIFITTSGFTSDAISFAHTIDYNVVLLDGRKVAELMIDFDIGVTEVSVYKLKRIDSDYFSNN
ncbi:MAG: restriction endonuclease [Chloroflexota bacterium]